MTTATQILQTISLTDGSTLKGFYISCTYYHRKRKVKKGRYPGGPKTLIESERVINGGASEEHIRHLKALKRDKKERQG